MEEKTTVELKAMCEEAGLATYGAKSVLIERLQKHAVAEMIEEAVMGEPSVEPEAEPVAAPAPAPAPAPVKSGIVAISSTAMLSTLPPVNHKAHVQETLDECRSRFHGIIVNYDINQEAFIFDGGRQGRTTTTARQPKKNVLDVAKSYYNLARGRNMEPIGEVI